MTMGKRFTYRKLNEEIAKATNGEVAMRTFEGKGHTYGFVFFDGASPAGEDREKRAQAHFKRFGPDAMSAISIDDWIEAAKAYHTAMGGARA